MRLVVLASALMLVTACGWTTSALAQGSPSREAPVGHRQPKAGELPQEQQQLSDPDKKNERIRRCARQEAEGHLSRLLGQSLRFFMRITAKKAHRTKYTAEVFEIVQQLPENDGECQYKIMSLDEPHLRVAKENQLRRV
jgi:hypothetical protein